LEVMRMVDPQIMTSGVSGGAVITPGEGRDGLLCDGRGNAGKIIRAGSWLVVSSLQERRRVCLTAATCYDFIRAHARTSVPAKRSCEDGPPFPRLQSAPARESARPAAQVPRGRGFNPASALTALGRLPGCGFPNK
jgi:hypothetical protein